MPKFPIDNKSALVQIMAWHWTGDMPLHDDVTKWKHFPRYWPFVRGIHRSPVNSPHKGQWRGALMISLICVWINGWVNNREPGDLRRYRAHYDVIVMTWTTANPLYWCIYASLVGNGLRTNILQSISQYICNCWKNFFKKLMFPTSHHCWQVSLMTVFE